MVQCCCLTEKDLGFKFQLGAFLRGLGMLSTCLQGFHGSVVHRVKKMNSSRAAQLFDSKNDNHDYST